MPAPAYINGTVCNVPLECLSRVMGGIEISIDEQSNTVSVKRLEYSDSTPLEPHYLDVVFTLKINASLDSIDENKYFAGQPLFTFQNDLSEYESCMNPTGELRDAFLMLLNKENPIDSSFEPSSIIDLPEGLVVPSKRGSVTLELDATAAKALEAMLLEMHSAGFDNVFVTSAYRGYSYQSALYNTYIEREMKTISSDAYSVLGKDYIEEFYTSQGITKLTREDAVKVVNSYSAIPGYSEHHTGLCVDLISTDMSDLTNVFAEKEVFSWLCANAWKFGFVLRYPEDKVDITGYSYESWHWRFVGRTHALSMLSSGKCLEEYLSSLPHTAAEDQ
jgi:LAS superfamily LD-carboxypeptidase LdcB